MPLNTAATTGELLDRVLLCPNLPTLPTVAVEVLDLTRDENVPMNSIAQVVQNDQALTSKILRTVNSSYYGLSTPCPSIARAITYLGLSTVKSLVLSFSLVECFNKAKRAESSFDYARHWRRSVYSACAARLIAQSGGLGDPEDAFIAALLQDIGALAMHIAIGDDYDQACSDPARPHEDLPAKEQQLFGFQHAEAGAQLAERWRLPASLVAGIRFHHRPSTTPADHARLLRAVTLGTLAAESLSRTDSRALVDRFFSESRSFAQLDHHQASTLLERASQGACEMSRLFKLDTGTAADVNRLLSEANDALVQHQIETDRQRDRLQHQNRELSRQAITDGLTGAFNRKYFDEMLTEQFQLAQESGTSLSVLFIDADHFKSVNDVHGHQVGDAVLIEMARRLNAATDQAGTVCRYGGEEFAILLPGYQRAPAGMMAETIRRQIQQKPFDVSQIDDGPGALPITVSIGVAAFEPQTADILRKSAHLLQAADKAVYSAKASGRNCVRIFNPKPSSLRSSQAASSPVIRRVEAQAPAQAICIPSRADQSKTGRHDRHQAPFRVLLVEDDPTHVRLLQTAFQQSVNVELVIASTGESAITILRNGLDGVPYPADIVLTDLRLPGISGIDVIRAVKSSGALRHIPVIVLTACDSEVDMNDCLAAGANAFLPKQALSGGPMEAIRDLIGFWSRARLAA